jgi:hypothetical protein
MNLHPLRVPVGLITAAGVVCGALLAVAPTAKAINSYNSGPAPERTEVGAEIALWDQDHDGVADHFGGVCSGAMISQSVFLTAAHCQAFFPSGTRFFVSLDQDVKSELDQARALGLSPAAQADWLMAQGHASEGTGHYHPEYGQYPMRHPDDVAVIDFRGWGKTPSDIWAFTPARLPSSGQLSAIGSRQLVGDGWTVVGYGGEEADNAGGGRPGYPLGGTRREAPEGFDSLTASWVWLAMNQSRSYGGACYGDSGGPNYVTIDGQLVLAATTITGDRPCYATNVTYRMDIPDVRSFLSAYVTLP